MMQYMAERFLYLPLPGLLLALAAVVLQLPQPRLCIIAATACVVVWCAASCNRMTIWHDDVTLFVRTSLEHPGIKRVEDNAVAAIFRLPSMSELFPDYIKTSSIRMGGSLTIKQAEPVIRILTQARNIFPTNQLVASALAFAYAKAGQWSQAINIADTSARQHPDSANSWFNLAAILRASGDPTRAREACARALAIHPDYIQALHLQIDLCEELKDYRSALACARKLETLEPKNPEIGQTIRRLQEKAGPPNQ
jgi:tetratricopeptide (TPR) repeat protein